MSQDKPKTLRITFLGQAGREKVDEILERLCRVSNVSPVNIAISGTGPFVASFNGRAERNADIIETMGQQFQQQGDPHYDLPDPAYDVFTDTLCCTLICNNFK